MDALDAKRLVAAWLLCAVAGTWLAGCAGQKRQPEPLPPQAVARPPAQPPPASEPPVAAPVKPSTVVIIDSPEEVAEAPPSLLEAAARERERRARIDSPTLILTNKNLGEFTKDQRLTVANPESDEAGQEAAAADEAATADEAYWRERVRDVRQRWSQAVEDVRRLESESADLRRQFYSTDDPYTRDNQIKPEWDRVLAELNAARREADAAPQELTSVLEEGRHAGALPGWLREGIELEPEAPPKPRRSADPQEPVVVGEEPGQP